MVEAWVIILIAGTATTVIGMLVTRMTTQNEVIRTQKETIDTQRRQLDRLEIAADVSNRLLDALPLPRSTGGSPT